MTLRLSDAIARARPILNDTKSALYRYADPELLAYANDAIAEMVTLAPTFFHADGQLTCVAGECLQQLNYDVAAALVSVVGVHNRDAITPVDMTTMNLYRPSWRADAAAPAVHWMPVADDPMRFYIYPQAPADQVLDVIYVAVPSAYLATDDVPLPLTVMPAIMDYIVARAESRDDEHVNSGRASQFLAAFIARFREPPAPAQGGHQ